MLHCSNGNPCSLRSIIVSGMLDLIAMELSFARTVEYALKRNAALDSAMVGRHARNAAAETNPKVTFLESALNIMIADT